METATPLLLHKAPKSHLPGTNNAGERAALHDITNDSPIVGLAVAAGSTPATARLRRTPGSGEALLRGQVKTLLHKVQEEACIMPARIHALLGVSTSLAPTPANTPQLLQVIAAPEEKLDECQLSRALVFDDSPAKSTQDDDDTSSAWSVQVHPSDEDALGELEEDEDCFEFGDVCEGMSRMTVSELRHDPPAFEGKHTRFVYSSDEDDDASDEEQVKGDAPATAST